MKTKLKCRQEFEPELGRLVDKAYAEPLHNSNNAWQQFNLSLVEDALERSNLPKHVKYSEIPADCVFKKYMNTLRNVARANLVFKKIRKWFMKAEMELVPTVSLVRIQNCSATNLCTLFRLSVLWSNTLSKYVHAYVGVQLREATSLFCRIEPPEGYMQYLSQSCLNYFNSVCIFFSSKVIQTVWTISYAIPYHSKFLFDQFGYALGINTMQGREAKHSVIAKFAVHSTPALRWSLIFRHEFISSIWLRKRDSKAVHFKHSHVNYKPDFVNTCNFCNCGLPKQPKDQKCDFCNDPMAEMVANSVANLQLDIGLANLLSTTSEI